MLFERPAKVAYLRRFVLGPQYFLEGGNPTTMNDFMKTRVPSHTDFHGKNVFYCSKTKKISFIDVETMANSFDPDNKSNSPISYDLLYMLLMSTKTFGNFMPKNDWEPFKKFLDAYTGEYKLHERAGILNYLESSFRQAKKIAFTDIFKNFIWKKRMSSQDANGMKELIRHLRYIASKQHSALRHQPLKDKVSPYAKYTKDRITEYYANIRYYKGRVQKF